jgi:CxxC motif-containing protein (DUF1111 family)
MRYSLLAAAVSAASALACADSAPTTSPASGGSDPLLASSAVSLPTPGAPLSGLSGAERRQFVRGSAIFNQLFTPATGLGPLFNESGCADCHSDPTPGGSGSEVEVHGSRYYGNGTCDLLEDQGGFVFQEFATPALTAATGLTSEPIPSIAAIGRRTTPQVFGRGLLDAVPDAELLALAASEARTDPRAAGRAAVLPDGRVGKFGRKANAATLLDFNTDAFFFEMGITSPARPVEGLVGALPMPPGVDPAPDPEISASDLAAANDFVSFLAAPTGSTEENVTFQSIGCATCHVPQLTTGPSPVPALSNRRVRAFSDLLLHDMGSGLADICLGVAKPSEFRTEPLMGLRLRTRYLHDGRASSLDEAIEAHGGQASAARRRYEGLTSAQRLALLQYLRTL